MKKTLLIAALLILGGCASSYTEPTLPADHPANAAAMEALPVTRWQTLDLARTDPVTPAQADAGMSHGGHETGNNAMSKPLEPSDHGGAHGHDAPILSPDGAAMYACPMHPEVTSDKPDQRCPKCGMKLMKQDGGKQS